MSIRPCNVSIFQTPRLREHWADVDETWQVYSVGSEKKLPGSGVLNFIPYAAWGHPEITCTALCSADMQLASSEQSRYAGFYIGKIQAKTFPALKTTQHAGLCTQLAQMIYPDWGALLH